MVLNNQTATLQVGNEVPVKTQSITNVSAMYCNNPYMINCDKEKQSPYFSGFGLSIHSKCSEK
jgi:hypothetical protein